ncbi:RNase P subunit p30 [Ferroglobus placidus DSM 10642]|uniref:Ribonuclease P protein component 3 n=1 Tax=Ferroglobus placidus (strain DSM 10642 / AEDII12DO) TaxID=589924 RepID=D3S2E7_FERPA|nr:RNase P subunit p30 family protein [Ferroglobus placidus]ADC64477.1 RNase P subunit p30 [Ferroglobus placidus DSM 10642]
MMDFLRFEPEYLLEGFDDCVVFGETEKYIQGCMIYATSTKELVSKLRKYSGFIGVLSPKVEVNRLAVMRKKVFVLLDSVERELDYTTVKLAAEKDVAIEVCFAKYLKVSGVKRSQLFERDRILFKIVEKFDAPFVLTSGAENFYEMRTKKQIYDFFQTLGANVKRAEEWMKRFERILKDEKFIMDGFEEL